MSAPSAQIVTTRTFSGGFLADRRGAGSGVSCGGSIAGADGSGMPGSDTSAGSAPIAAAADATAGLCAQAMHSATLGRFCGSVLRQRATISRNAGEKSGGSSTAFRLPPNPGGGR